MWCERVIRKLVDSPTREPADRSVDWVDLQWNECGRILKKQTRGGRAVRVLLPPGQRLGHNDVIYEDPSLLIAVQILPCEVIVASIVEPRLLAILALELGNLHLPVQIETDCMIFIEDGPAMAVVDALQIAWKRAVRRFEPVAVMSAPAVELSPALRVIIRSQNENDQVGDRAEPRNSSSSA